MWITKTRSLNSGKLYVPPMVQIFSNEPTLAPDGRWYNLDAEGKVIEHGIEIPSSLISCAVMLKEGDCMEVITLPKPTLETLHTNPVYKTIIDYGGVLRDNQIGDVVIGEYDKRFEYCTHCGRHPWCETGVHCMGCEEYHFNIDRLITKLIQKQYSNSSSKQTNKVIMKRVTFKVAKAIKDAGYWQERLCGDYPIWKIEDTVIRFDTPWGVIGYGMPTYIDVWLWLWREKDLVKMNVWDKYINDIANNYIDPEEATEKAIDYLVDNKLLK